MRELLRADSLGKAYGSAGEKVRAIDGVDLTACRGEYVAITGRSGSGKTTLLSLLGGLDRPTSGEVWFDGKSLGSLTESELAGLRRSHIGLVFQEASLVAGLTALDNVRLPLFFGGGLRSGSDRARELLEEMELGARQRHLPLQLSRGEAQRVSIARAVIRDPDLILADEPTGNLDLESTAVVRRLLKQLVSEQEKTVIVATHDMELAADADRRVELRYGKVVEA